MMSQNRDNSQGKRPQAKHEETSQFNEDLVQLPTKQLNVMTPTDKEDPYTAAGTHKYYELLREQGGNTTANEAVEHLPGLKRIFLTKAATHELMLFGYDLAEAASREKLFQEISYEYSMGGAPPLSPEQMENEEVFVRKSTARWQLERNGFDLDHPPKAPEVENRQEAKAEQNKSGKTTENTHDRTIKGISEIQSGMGEQFVNAFIGKGYPHGGSAPRENVQEADLTVVFTHGPPAEDTLPTINLAREMDKQLKVVDFSELTPEQAADDIYKLLREADNREKPFQIINGVGPGKSKDPDIGDKVFETVTTALDALEVYRETRQTVIDIINNGTPAPAFQEGKAYIPDGLSTAFDTHEDILYARDARTQLKESKSFALNNIESTRQAQQKTRVSEEIELGFSRQEYWTHADAIEAAGEQWMQLHASALIAAKHLESKDPELRIMALDTVGAHEEFVDSDLSRIHQAANDTNPEIRTAAEKVLTKTPQVFFYHPNPRQMSTLLQVLSESDITTWQETSRDAVVKQTAEALTSPERIPEPYLNGSEGTPAGDKELFQKNVLFVTLQALVHEPGRKERDGILESANKMFGPEVSQSLQEYESGSKISGPEINQNLQEASVSEKDITKEKGPPENGLQQVGDNNTEEKREKTPMSEHREATTGNTRAETQTPDRDSSKLAFISSEETEIEKAVSVAGIAKGIDVQSIHAGDHEFQDDEAKVAAVIESSDMTVLLYHDKHSSLDKIQVAELAAAEAGKKLHILDLSAEKLSEEADKLTGRLAINEKQGIVTRNIGFIDTYENPAVQADDSALFSGVYETITSSFSAERASESVPEPPKENPGSKKPEKQETPATALKTKEGTVTGFAWVVAEGVSMYRDMPSQPVILGYDKPFGHPETLNTSTVVLPENSLLDPDSLAVTSVHPESRKIHQEINDRLSGLHPDRQNIAMQVRDFFKESSPDDIKLAEKFQAYTSGKDVKINREEFAQIAEMSGEISQAVGDLVKLRENPPGQSDIVQWLQQEKGILGVVRQDFDGLGRHMALFTDKDGKLPDSLQAESSAYDFEGIRREPLGKGFQQHLRENGNTNPFYKAVQEYDATFSKGVGMEQWKEVLGQEKARKEHEAHLPEEGPGEIVYLAAAATGNNPRRDGVISVSIINQSGKVLMDELVNPRRALTPEMEKRAGISNDMVQHANTLSGMREELSDILLHANEVRIAGDGKAESFVLRAVTSPDSATVPTSRYRENEKPMVQIRGQKLENLPGVPTGPARNMHNTPSHMLELYTQEKSDQPITTLEKADALKAAFEEYETHGKEAFERRVAAHDKKTELHNKLLTQTTLGAEVGSPTDVSLGISRLNDDMFQKGDAYLVLQATRRGGFQTTSPENQVEILQNIQRSIKEEKLPQGYKVPVVLSTQSPHQIESITKNAGWEQEPSVQNPEVLQELNNKIWKEDGLVSLPSTGFRIIFFLTTRTVAT